MYENKFFIKRGNKRNPIKWVNEATSTKPTTSEDVCRFAKGEMKNCNDVENKVITYIQKI